MQQDRAVGVSPPAAHFSCGPLARVWDLRRIRGNPNPLTMGKAGKANDSTREVSVSKLKVRQLLCRVEPRWFICAITWKNLATCAT